MDSIFEIHGLQMVTHGNALVERQLLLKLTHSFDF